MKFAITGMLAILTSMNSLVPTATATQQQPQQPTFQKLEISKHDASSENKTLAELEAKADLDPTYNISKDLLARLQSADIDPSDPTHTTVSPMNDYRGYKQSLDKSLEIKLVSNLDNLDQPLTRGDYVQIINKFNDYYQIGKKPCCMGDTPDFSETPTTHQLYNEVVKAANHGFYCTREGSDTAKPFTYKELIKCLNKYTTEIQSIPATFNNAALTDEEAYINLLKVSPSAVNLSDTHKDIVSRLFRYEMLPFDELSRIPLEKQLTKGELLHILISVGDTILLYNNSNISCKDCLLQNIDSFYPPRRPNT